jgi:hypothetical protein
MFDLSVEALATWIEESKLTADSVELVSLGERHDDIALPNGVVLRSRGKVSWEDYPEVLRSGDIGLSLMLSPHPSHPPLEWAASGIVCVTNLFEGKDLAQYSPNIVSVMPTVEGLCAGLEEAWSRSADFASRKKGAVVDEAALGSSLGTVVEDLVEHLKDCGNDSAH